MAYTYKPIAPGEIRLLKPAPPSSSSAGLHFEFVYVQLNRSPKYAALSYTWGPPGDIHEVYLDHHPFRIRQNLWDALQQLHVTKVPVGYLWIDAICIQQGNEDDALRERSVQITSMKEIYERATQVLVWLGKPQNEANNRLAISMMHHFDKMYRGMVTKGRPYRPWWLPRSKPRTSGQDHADFLLLINASTDKKVFDVPGSDTHRGWLGIASLWKKPWWNRSWVLQESTVPENATTYYIAGVHTMPFTSKVKFMCGDQMTNWSHMAVTSAVASSLAAKPDIDLAFLSDARQSFTRLYNLRMQRSYNLQTSFLEMLQTFRHTGCSDPRDKVYAPLCLATDDVRDSIVPDYLTKSVLDVYLDVVRFHLRNPGRELDFLGYARYDKDIRTVKTPQGRESVLPSWVPNFATSADITPIPKILYTPEVTTLKKMSFVDTRGIPNGRAILLPTYQPLGDTPPKSFIEGRQLHVSGVMIDVLKDIIINQGVDIEQIRATGRQKGRAWAFEADHKYFTGETFGDAINRTTVLDLVWNEDNRPSERGNMLDLAFLRRPRTELSVQEYRQQINLRTAQVQASASRNLGQTRQLYLCMIPDTAVVGDSLWALAGGQVLYVLRSAHADPKQYHYVGECYVHGLMDGDIIRRMYIGEATMEEISLI